MSKKLEPCPFCGGEAKHISNGWENQAVYCTQCGASTMRWYKTEEEAVAAWNRRAATEANEALTLEDIGAGLDMGAGLAVTVKDLETGVLWPAITDRKDGEILGVMGADMRHCVFYGRDYCKTWIAYRRPPEGGEG